MSTTVHFLVDDVQHTNQRQSMKQQQEPHRRPSNAATTGGCSSTSATTISPQSAAGVPNTTVHCVCPICLDPFDTPVEVLPCKHVFCRSCIEEHMAGVSHVQGCRCASCKGKGSCPLCRTVMCLCRRLPDNHPVAASAMLVTGTCQGFVERLPSSPLPTSSSSSQQHHQVPGLRHGSAGGGENREQESLGRRSGGIGHANNSGNGDDTNNTLRSPLRCTWSGTRKQHSEHLTQVPHAITLPPRSSTEDAVGLAEGQSSSFMNRGFADLETAEAANLPLEQAGMRRASGGRPSHRSYNGSSYTTSSVSSIGNTANHTNFVTRNSDTYFESSPAHDGW